MVSRKVPGCHGAWPDYCLTGNGIFCFIVVYFGTEREMTKERLTKIIQELLQTDTNLHFLDGLAQEDLEKLVAVIRDRVGQLHKAS